MDDTNLTWTVPETARVLRLSRSFTYDAIARGEIPSVRIGGKILVPKAALMAMLARALPEQERELAAAR